LDIEALNLNGKEVENLVFAFVGEVFHTHLQLCIGDFEELHILLDLFDIESDEVGGHPFVALLSELFDIGPE
jgi:hypothetical protein